MSPLACSLFAFALVSLLATAHGDCSVKQFGRTTNNVVPLDTVELTPPMTEIDNNNGKCPPGMHVVGQAIVACNNDPNGPAPAIIGPPPGKMHPIYVSCIFCPLGGYAQVTLFCDY